MAPGLAKKTRFTWLDAALLVLMAAGAAYLLHRVSAGLSYHWDWGVIPQYLFRYDEAAGQWVPNLLMQGLFTTIRLSLWATLLATLLGGLAGISRLSASLFRRLVSRGYVESVRNLPPLVLVFIFYFFISQQVLPHLGLEAYLRSCSPGCQQAVAFWFAPGPEHRRLCLRPDHPGGVRGGLHHRDRARGRAVGGKGPVGGLPRPGAFPGASR